jgi:hypothetical protein
MEDLKELVLKYREFLTDVIIAEPELYCNFEDLISESERQYRADKEELGEYIEKMILKDISYDFIFNIQAIKNELTSAKDFWYEEYSKEKSLNIYKEIKKVFKDFIIEDFEKEM